MILALALVTAWPVGSEERPDRRFLALAERFQKLYLESNPETATNLGDHRFDDRWTDFSPAGLERTGRWQNEVLQDLESIPRQELALANQVDYDILRHHLEASQWSLYELGEVHRNPLLYNPGPGLFALVSRDFAPLEQRLEALAGRLEGIPRYLREARQQLMNPARIATETAIQQNQGNLAFVRDDLSVYFAQVPALQPRLERAQEIATRALEEYGLWLSQDLLPRSTGDFRLGPELYRKKLHYTLESSITPEDLAARAEQDLLSTQQEMAQVARSLYPKVAGRSCDGLSDAEVCRRVLKLRAEHRPNGDNIVELARRSLARATDFVAARQLVSLPQETCTVIEMPEFYRGVAIAYCDSPGPLEKAGTTFYAIAPTPSDWPPERVESFYREYNLDMLDNLTVHEAMPGHFLQLMHANRYKAGTPLRAILQSGTFVEGWATYAEELMVSHGYGGAEVRMQQLKMRLRLILNTLLDQRVHLGQGTEEETVSWLQREGFQEEGEARGKWRRACLTSAQLSTYYLGNCEVRDLVRDYRKAFPQASLRNVHDQILSQGSPAVRHLRRLLLKSAS